MFIKRDIYKYEFYLCNILKNGCKLQVNSVCNFFLLSQIVVNVDKNDKKNIPCALTCTLSGFYVTEPNTFCMAFRVKSGTLGISASEELR